MHLDLGDNTSSFIVRKLGSVSNTESVGSYNEKQNHIYIDDTLILKKRGQRWYMYIKHTVSYTVLKYSYFYTVQYPAVNLSLIRLQMRQLSLY